MSETVTFVDPLGEGRDERRVPRRRRDVVVVRIPEVGEQEEGARAVPFPGQEARHVRSLH